MGAVDSNAASWALSTTPWRHATRHQAALIPQPLASRQQEIALLTGAHMTTRRNSSTWGASGAPPLTTALSCVRVRDCPRVWSCHYDERQRQDSSADRLEPCAADQRKKGRSWASCWFHCWFHPASCTHIAHWFHHLPPSRTSGQARWSTWGQAHTAQQHSAPCLPGAQQSWRTGGGQPEARPAWGRGQDVDMAGSRAIIRAATEAPPGKAPGCVRAGVAPLSTPCPPAHPLPRPNLINKNAPTPPSATTKARPPVPAHSPPSCSTACACRRS